MSCFSHEIQYLFMCIFQSSRVSKLKFRLTEMELGHAERRGVEEVSKLLGNWPRNKTFSLIIQLHMDPKIGLGSNFGSASLFFCINQHKSNFFFRLNTILFFFNFAAAIQKFCKTEGHVGAAFSNKSMVVLFHVKQGFKQGFVMYFG